MRVIERFITSIQTDRAQSYKNMTVHFCHAEKGGALNILNYDEAIDSNMLSVSEIGEGDVQNLMFQNKGVFPIFVPEGAIITGLKQSRGIRVSFIIKEHDTLKIPVHCLEQRRWSDRKAAQKSDIHLNSKLRASNLRHTGESLKKKEGYSSQGSQQAAWEDIRLMKERKQKKMGRHIQSPGDYIGDIFREDKANIEEYMRAFVCPDTATGLLALIDNQVVGLDIFGDAKLFERNYKSIMSGIAVEATDEREANEKKTGTPEEFLQSILAAKEQRYKAVGYGIDLRLESAGIVGCALVGEQVFHLEAFAV